jgi:hypothetical protein
VEDNCKNDPAVLLSSGFRAASRNRASSPLGNPSILSVDFGNNTELVLKVTPVSRAKSYEVRAGAIGAQCHLIFQPRSEAEPLERKAYERT